MACVGRSCWVLLAGSVSRVAAVMAMLVLAGAMPGCFIPELRPYDERIDALPRVTHDAATSRGIYEISSIRVGGGRGEAGEGGGGSSDGNAPRGPGAEGADDIVVVLLHGSPGRATDWGDLLLDPPAGTEVIALDRPGFGCSRPLEEAVKLSDQAAAVEPVLPEAGSGRRAVVVGYSFGGAVAVRTAVAHPERVGALVLIGAALDPELEDMLFHQYIGELPGVSWLLASHLRHTNRELFALARQLRELAPRLGELTTPIEVLHGEMDELVPIENVGYMRQRFVSAEVNVVIVPDGPHPLPFEAPSAVRAAVERAVASVRRAGHDYDNDSERIRRNDVSR